MEQQVIQVVAAQTEVQKLLEAQEMERLKANEAYKLRVASIQAAFVPVLNAELERQENAEGDDEDAEGIRIALNHDDTQWLFTNEYYSRRVLHRFCDVVGRDTVVALGECEELNWNSWVGVSLTDIVKGPRSNLLSFIRLCAGSSDKDVSTMLEMVLKGCDFQLSWPTDKVPVSLMDLYILFKMQEIDKPYITRLEDGQMMKLDQVIYHAPSMWNPEYIELACIGTFVQNGKLYEAKTDAVCDTQKIYLKDMPVRLSTEEDLANGIAQGKELFNLLTNGGTEAFAHLTYEGIAYQPGMWGSKIPHAVKSRVVVDPEGCRLMDTSKFNSLMRLGGVELALNKKTDEPVIVERAEEARYATILPQIIFFNLNNGEWMSGELDRTKAIAFRQDAFDKLVLPPQSKRLVESLVVNAGAGANVSADLIDGKGGGAIFLLDGVPGTGKTLTAEATAEKLTRVLYKVGMGELGITAESVEKRLSMVLQIAHRWNAILLLDEADVFLEKRSMENLARNAMVAVFLRLLEYYTGILFLTTNRGQNIDAAAMSRITLALHFVKVNEEGREVIWRNLLANGNISLSEKEIKLLASMDVNGREIKNAINSSRSLAATDGTPVTYTHIREIMDSTSNFRAAVKESAERNY